MGFREFKIFSFEKLKVAPFLWKLKIFIYIFLCINLTTTPQIAPTLHWDHDLNKHEPTLPEDTSHKLQLFWLIVLWVEDFKKKKFSIYLKFLPPPPNCSPTLPSGTMIWTNLIIQYLRMLSHKFQHSWPNGFLEDF